MRNWKHIRLIQNIVILFLSCSALLLLLQVVSFEIGEDGSISALFSRFSNVVIPQSSQESSSANLTYLSAPVNIMVTGDYGRCALLLPEPDSQQLSYAASLLKEGLGSAAQESSVSSRSLHSAVNGSGIFFDYLTSLPVSVTAGRLGVSLTDPHSARYFLLAANSSGVVCLYHWEDPGSAVCYETAISLQSFTEVLNYYEPNNAFFAFENETFHTLLPYTVLTTDAREVSLLSAATPQEVSDVDALLTKLDFNAYTHFRYTQSYDGSEVILESPRSLQVRKDGTVIYSGDQDTASSLFQIYQEGDTPTAAEAVLAALKLAYTVLPSTQEQGYWLSSLEQTASGWTVSLDYLWGGIPVYFSDGSSAMVVEIEGSAITAFTFFCRRYTASESGSYALLPLQFAAVIAQSYENGTLTFGQVDYGTEAVLPDWLIQ